MANLIIFCHLWQMEGTGFVAVLDCLADGWTGGLRAELYH